MLHPASKLYRIYTEFQLVQHVLGIHIVPGTPGIKYMKKRYSVFGKKNVKWNMRTTLDTIKPQPQNKGYETKTRLWETLTPINQHTTYMVNLLINRR